MLWYVNQSSILYQVLDVQSLSYCGICLEEQWEIAQKKLGRGSLFELQTLKKKGVQTTHECIR